jgi:hypothetical protein
MSRLARVLSLATLCLAALGSIEPALGQQGPSGSNRAGEEAAARAIELFDDLCIKNAYEGARFYMAIRQMARRKMARDEYSKFWPEPAQSEEFYDLSASNGSARVFVGRVSVERGMHNCIVAFKAHPITGLGHWLNLFRSQYAKGNELKENNGPPHYFVERGRDKDVMVQIGANDSGFIIYYSYFK